MRHGIPIQGIKINWTTLTMLITTNNTSYQGSNLETTASNALSDRIHLEGPESGIVAVNSIAGIAAMPLSITCIIGIPGATLVILRCAKSH